VVEPRADAPKSAASASRVWRLLLVDDDPAFLAAARRMLGGDARVAIVGEGTSGEAALALARSSRADAVLLDVQMPAMDGFETAERLRAEHGALRVVLTSLDDQRLYHRQAAALGTAFLPKRNWSADALLGLIEAAG
jgi:DNA-binding NarL/FixJ family response regulator